MATAGQQHTKTHELMPAAYLLQHKALRKMYLEGKSLDYTINWSNQFHFKVCQWALFRHGATKWSDENMDNLPDTFQEQITFTGRGMDSLKMHIAASAQIRRTIPLPASLPCPLYPQLEQPCKGICFSGFPDSPPHPNFPAPLAKPGILHWLHFPPFQKTATSSHLLLWSLLNHKDEGGWG